MRDRSEFERLVYEKADALAAKEFRDVHRRKAALSTAAAFTVVTAAVVGSVFAFNRPELSTSDAMNAAAVGEQEGAGSGKMYANSGAASGEYNGDYGSADVYTFEKSGESGGDEFSIEENDNVHDEEYEESAEGVDTDTDTAEQEETEKTKLSKYEIYEGLPIEVEYYYSSDVKNGNKKLVKTITGEEEIDGLLRKLRNAEQVRATDESDTDTYAIFNILRKDTEHSIWYNKFYFVSSTWVCVNEYSQDVTNDYNEYAEERYVNDVYSFGMSEEFLDIMREYFDEDFTLEQ